MRTAPKTQPGLFSEDVRSLFDVPHFTCRGVKNKLNMHTV